VTLDPQAHRLLTEAVEDTLALLRVRFEDVKPDTYRRGASSLPGLLGQCKQRLETVDATPPASIRAIHHFACTGGTLICKCLAAMPNTVLLSEIDPLSNMHLQASGARFLPTDIIAGLQTGLRDVSEDLVVELFQCGLEKMLDRLTQQGLDLVIRSHAHTQFCTERPADTRPSVHDMLCTVAPTRAVVTLRHPLDSFLSLAANGWKNFTPFTLDEYARRYMLFLNAHDSLPWYRYEDFLETPRELTEQICAALDLCYWPTFQDMLPVMNLSGDSGRKGFSITPRPRREVPADVEKSRKRASHYRALCDRLDYPA